MRVFFLVNAVHPGNVATNLFRYNQLFQFVGPSVSGMANRSPLDGALSSIFTALSPLIEKMSINGSYLWDTDIYPSSRASVDRKLQEQLWDKSLELLRTTGVVDVDRILRDSKVGR
jgi:hypothetical protein